MVGGWGRGEGEGEEEGEGEGRGRHTLCCASAGESWLVVH